MDEETLRKVIREEMSGQYYSEEVREEYCLKDPFLNKEKFKNRRRMAWLAFFCMIALTVFIFWYIPAENLNHYEFIVAWVFGTFSSIIVTYMGVTMIPYFGKKQQPPNQFGGYRPTRPTPYNNYNRSDYYGGDIDER